MQTVRVIICMMAVLHAARTSFWGWTLREVAADVCHREAQLFIWYLAAAPTRTQLWQGWYDFCELVPIIWQRVSIVWMRVRAPSYGHSHVSNALMNVDEHADNPADIAEHTLQYLAELENIDQQQTPINSSSNSPPVSEPAVDDELWPSTDGWHCEVCGETTFRWIGEWQCPNCGEAGSLVQH